MIQYNNWARVPKLPNGNVNFEQVIHEHRQPQSNYPTVLEVVAEIACLEGSPTNAELVANACRTWKP